MDLRKFSETVDDVEDILAVIVCFAATLWVAAGFAEPLNRLSRPMGSQKAIKFLNKSTKSSCSQRFLKVLKRSSIGPQSPQNESKYSKALKLLTVFSIGTQTSAKFSK